VAALARFPARPSWFSAPVVGAMLGDDAGVIGAALAAIPRPKRAILVNGVPASGKSAVADALSRAAGWPILRLDTIKDPFLQELAPVDRLFNRTLGRASYASIFNVIADAPAGTTVIIDAWFGFQPVETLTLGLTRAGITDTAEIWCHAPPETTAARYAARIADRPPGHPGADYVPELRALAARAKPMSIGPVCTVDTTTPLNLAALLDWLHQTKGPSL
jgi:glucokinase